MLEAGQTVRTWWDLGRGDAATVQGLDDEVPGPLASEPDGDDTFIGRAGSTDA